MEDAWVWSSSLPLAHSYFFFLLLAQATQFLGCVLFSLVDLSRSRVPLKLMILPALWALLGFVPFVLMWYYEHDVVHAKLPKNPPTLAAFATQLVFCGVSGDFLHYLTHRWLHSNRFLRLKVHKVHHDYEGSLYSWVGMQVHPVEVAMITAAIYLPFLMFAHPMVLWTFAVLATCNATFAHSGYEGGFASWGVPFALTSSDHQLHHDLNSTKNFGNVFKVWDSYFGTYGVNSKYPTESLWKTS